MNAKKELIEHVEYGTIKCAKIEYVKRRAEGTITIILKIGYEIEEAHDFLEKLDFEYDSGYGTQYLFGTIWFEDGTWSSRSEYDGMEWWEHYELPQIPKELIK